LSWLEDSELRQRSADARIRLALARLYLKGQGQEATLQQLDLADRLLESDEVTLRMERDALRSRLEIARGDYDPAYRRLKRTLKLASPRQGGNSWRATMWTLRLRSEPEALTEAYALLAVAAHETGNTDDYRWAVREARERGVDMEALTGSASMSHRSRAGS